MYLCARFQRFSRSVETSIGGLVLAILVVQVVSVVLVVLVIFVVLVVIFLLSLAIFLILRLDLIFELCFIKSGYRQLRGWLPFKVFNKLSGAL